MICNMSKFQDIKVVLPILVSNLRHPLFYSSKSNKQLESVLFLKSISPV